jgi:hypothetical protein
VSDFLSRRELQLSTDCHSDTDLTNYVLTNFPNQVPYNFRVCPLSKINSFICSTLVLLTVSSTESKKRARKQSMGPGAGGVPIASSSAKPIPSSTQTTPANDNRLSLPLPNDSAKITSLPETVRSLFFRRLSARTLATWHRSSGVTTGQGLPQHPQPFLLLSGLKGETKSLDQC